MKPKLTWLLAPISLGAFLATWGGWAKLATMTGYGNVEMLGGQDWSRFNIGIVLPITVEPFGALAAAVAFNPKVRSWARVIAGVMALSTLVAAGICQAVVHGLTVQGKTAAPDYVVAVTSVLPVIVLGLGGALAMLNGVRTGDVGTSHEMPGTGVLGRIGKALGDVAASQAERLAAASQASRDAVPIVPAEVVETIPETSREDVPAPSQPILEVPLVAVPNDIPAAQTAFKALPKEEQMRLVGEARLRPGKPSYEKLGREFGISTSEAGRLGKAYEDRLKADPVIIRDETVKDGWGHPWDAELDEGRLADGVNPIMNGASA